MDPLCTSLVHQYLKSTNSALTDQFKTKYQPTETNLRLKEVLVKCNIEQLARNIVYQHLRTVAPSLALEFRDTHNCYKENVPQKLMELVKKFHQTLYKQTSVKLGEGEEKLGEGEEKLARSIVYQHLNRVAPSLALEFREAHSPPLEEAPEPLMELIKKSHLIKWTELDKEEKLKTTDARKRVGTKSNTFTNLEVLRVERAIANKESIGALAKEMGRTYSSVHNKVHTLKRAVGLHKGKFRAEDNERIRQALENNEDYKTVAKELRRDPRIVFNKILLMKSNPTWEQGQKTREFSLAEDFLILETVIPNLKSQRLSGTGFLSQSTAMRLATELQRYYISVKLHWEQSLQPMLLQHYTGTTCFRVERMMTSLVAQKYKDYRGVDWLELVTQHKEFAGHTNASIRKLFQNCLQFARKQKHTDDVSLQEVAECTEVYQARKEPPAKIVRREKIVEYFSQRVEELGINIVV